MHRRVATHVRSCIPWPKECGLCRLDFHRGPCAGLACSIQQCVGTVRTCHQVAPPAGCTSLALAWGTRPVVEDHMLDGQSMTSKLLSDNGPLSVLQRKSRHDSSMDTQNYHILQSKSIPMLQLHSFHCLMRYRCEHALEP